jgi:alanine dehydrogenase
LKIGIIKEGKIPPDKRVALSPEQCKFIKENFGIDVIVQSSNIRVFKDEDYLKENIEVREDVSDCDILLGIKEVPVKDLIEEKKYFFFSHTIKLQEHNKKLLKEILNKNITLVDYELLVEPISKKRLIGFGRYAGIVGTYNGFITYGLKKQLYNLKPAYKCEDINEVYNQLKKVKLPNDLKIVLTGDGRVANGSVELLEKLNIKKVEPEDFLSNNFDEPVFTKLTPKYLFKNKNNKEWDRQYFYNNPEEYQSDFSKYTKVAELFIAGHFWNPKTGIILSDKDIKDKDFKIKVIADISCDINGPIVSTIRASTIENPIYGYDRFTNKETNFMNENAIAIMAVDNLPCELPKDASIDFGNEFIKKILPEIINGDKNKIIENATITEKGKLKEKYSYMYSMLE